MKQLIIAILFLASWNLSYAQEKYQKPDPVKIYNSNELEKAPVYLGGEKELGKFISQNIHYPIEAAKVREGGLAIVSIIIDEHGNVSNPNIIKSAVKTIPVTSRQDLNEEALRVMMLTNGKWTPGEVNGHKVSSFYIMPIRFTPPKLAKNKNKPATSNNYSALKCTIAQ